MYRITRARIGGFRRLHNIDLEMRPFMVLIGANGVGKTSFLDALALLSASAAGNLSLKMAELGGLDSLLTRNGTGELSLQFRIDGPSGLPFDYELLFAPTGIGYEIRRERLVQQSGAASPEFVHIDSRLQDIQYFQNSGDVAPLRPNWDHNPYETSLGQIPKIFQQPEELRKKMAGTLQYHALDVDPQAPIKLPQPMRPATLPGENGEDLVSLLYYLREQNPRTYETILDTLHAAFDSFEYLSFPPVAAGTLSMLWKDKNFEKPFYIHELSEGALRFLWLITTLQSPGLSMITMIDEPEISLHPEHLDLFADLLREASLRTQVIVATHSDRLIRHLKPHEIVAMDIDDTGLSSATWADTLDLDGWLDEFSLDEIWSMGRMGARA